MRMGEPEGKEWDEVNAKDRRTCEVKKIICFGKHWWGHDKSENLTQSAGPPLWVPKTKKTEKDAQGAVSQRARTEWRIVQVTQKGACVPYCTKNMGGMGRQAPL